MNGLPPDVAALFPQGGGGPNGNAANSLSYPYLRVNEKDSPHGIGMHASPMGKVSVSYALNGRYETFQTEVSINDTSPRSPVGLTFSVNGDGKRLWQTLVPVTTRNQTQKCNVSVRGVQVLELTVTNTSGDPQSVAGAHSIWVEPQVIGR